MKTRTVHPFIILAGAILISQIARAAAAPSRKHAPPDLQGTTQQPLIIKSVPNAEERRRDAEYRADRAADLTAMHEAADERQRSDTTVRRIGELTAAILVIQFLAFVYQAWQMKRSVDAMRDATKVAEDAADKAKTSADAAVNANELNRDALLLDQRPWLAITDKPYLEFNRSGSDWQLNIDVPVQNTGRTPAHNVRFTGQLLNLAEKDDIERRHLTFCQGVREEIVTSTAQICFPERPIKVNGRIQIPREFQAAILPDAFVLSGCVYYNGLSTPEMTHHITTILYKIHIRESDAKQRWQNPANVSIGQSSFIIASLPYGWIAD